MSSDEKYQSLSSVSSTEVVSPVNLDNTEKDQTIEDENLGNPADDIEEVSAEKYDNEQDDLQKKPHTEEDDDTSKQATQNYDLNDNEQGVSVYFRHSLVLLAGDRIINENICLLVYLKSLLPTYP
jgi:hypothetical protein